MSDDTRKYTERLEEEGLLVERIALLGGEGRFDELTALLKQLPESGLGKRTQDAIEARASVLQAFFF
jgi:hypothetical protein